MDEILKRIARLEESEREKNMKLDKILELLQGDELMRRKGLLQIIEEHEDLASYFKKTKVIIAWIVTIATSVVAFIEFVINKK